MINLPPNESEPGRVGERVSAMGILGEVIAFGASDIVDCFEAKPKPRPTTYMKGR